MGYVLKPSQPMQQEVRRVVAERLGAAIEQLDRVMADRKDADLETAVHEARKRCKASRGLARLLEPTLGDEFRPFDRLVRDAATALSTLRDAHAVLNALEQLLEHRPDAVALRAVRNRQAAISADAAIAAVGMDDDRLSTSRALLVDARNRSQVWPIPRGFDAVEDGLAATYRQGRSGLRRARADPTDRRFHDWRKAVKYLWYQVQLLQDAAPSVLGPLADQLDQLAETLGDDHDLAVLVELLDEDPDRYGSPSDVAVVRELARGRQLELREHAVRSGATIYAEPAAAFVKRIARYWKLTVRLGPEWPVVTGPTDATHATGPAGATDPVGGHAGPVRSLVERERRFLVDVVPADLTRIAATIELRQGYLAAAEQRSVRVRDAGPEGCTLTIKAGGGAERTELEWPIERDEFEAAWPHTDGQRIEKTRHRIPFGVHVIELDVFGGDLDGLVIAEVEFDATAVLDEFVPPSWFGREVTDDGAYTNASLALHGLP